MLHEQASHLRALHRRVQRRVADPVPPPRIFAVSAGRADVGATAISLNLAIALAQQGQRTVIVDADLARADVAARCGLTAAATIADVLAARRGIHEVLERGPGGIQLAAGSRTSECRALCSDRAVGRLLDQIQALGRHTDAVVIDAGSAPTGLMNQVWQAADRVLVVTTPDPQAVLDAYATIKTLAVLKDERSPIELIVNQAAGEAQAGDVCGRMQRSCQRFLGLAIQLCGWLPVLDSSAEPRTTVPWVLQQPVSSAAAGIEQMAARLLSGQDDPVHEAA